MSMTADKQLLLERIAVALESTATQRELHNRLQSNRNVVLERVLKLYEDQSKNPPKDDSIFGQVFGRSL